MPEGFQIPKISIGADPEVFIRDTKTGKIVSAHDLLPGNKLHPHPVSQGAVQVDGVAGEYNIIPCFDRESFAKTNEHVLSQMKNILGPTKEIVIEPVAIFEKGYWDGLPDGPKELGCNPDYNGWTRDINPPPDSSKTPFMRTASGHIHIGWSSEGQSFDPEDNAHFNDCCVVARQMDYYLGIQSLLWDPDPRRRTLYGKAGCFRPKSYGMEYRAMSNGWLLDKKLMTWVWNQAYFGISHLFQGEIAEQTFGDSARRIIDNNIVDWVDRPEFSKLRKNSVIPVIPKKIPGTTELVAGSPKKKKKNPNAFTGNMVDLEATASTGFSLNDLVQLSSNTSSF